MATEPREDPAMIQAADFLLRARAAPRDADVRAEVEAWLRSDPSHQHAWDEVRSAWSMLGELPRRVAPSPPAPAARRPALRRASDRSTRRRWPAVAAASIAACLVAALAPTAMLRLKADEITGVAERRAVSLADGTRIVLGPESAIAYDETGRGVRILTGQAWFEVQHDADRPFVVRAGDVTATDLGTAFEVRRRPDAVEIAVAHGLVGVARKGRATTDGTLRPGERMVIASGDGLARKEHVALAAIAPWRDGYLLVKDAPIGEVVAELRRYQPGLVLIADRSLAERRVTGLYALDQPEAALRALATPSGGRVRRITPYLHVLSSQ